MLFQSVPEYLGKHGMVVVRQGVWGFLSEIFLKCSVGTSQGVKIRLWLVPSSRRKARQAV